MIAEESITVTWFIQTNIIPFVGELNSISFGNEKFNDYWLLKIKFIIVNFNK